MTDQAKPKHEAWSNYPETVLIFAGEPEIMIDLRVPVPSPARDALAAIGLDEPFAIVTPFNPRGVVLREEENSRRLVEFEAELRSSGLEYQVIDACSPDESHCECSVALKIERQRALDIAIRWEQIAIFWWDGSRFWIYGAIWPIEPPIALPGS